MKRWKSILLATLILGILALAYIWFFVYNKPHTDFVKAAPDHLETAQSLYDHYTGGANATINYDGSVVQFSGVPVRTESIDSLKVIVFAFNEGMFGDEGIRCTLLPPYHEQADNLPSGTAVTIKGFCSGYNGTDIIMESCSIVN